jgi:hypothetical protein
VGTPTGLELRRAVLRQDGWVITLVVLAAPTGSRSFDALGPVVTRGSFGVGRGFLALVVLFAFMFGLIVLGGHLRASWQRRRRDKSR